MQNYRQIAFLFPGQGAQYVGMGKDFADTFPTAKRTFEEADDVLKRKLSSIVFEGPEDILTETKNSQVAIFVTSIAILRVLQELFPELKPSVCAGLSLGEYTALHASSRMGFAETLQLVQLRGQFMNEACTAVKGTMAAIFGLKADVLEEIVTQLNMPKDLWIANFNCPGQIVISGTVKGVEAASAEAKAKGAKHVIPLQVHGAFHSGLMEPAEKRLKEYIDAADLKESSVNLVMNVPGDFVKELPEIRHYMIKQVTSPVRWEQGIRSMDAKGINLYLEIGCKKALKRFNKEIGVSGLTLGIEKVSELQQIEKIFL